MPISPISIRFQKPTIPSFKSKVVWEADNKKSPEELKNLIDEFEENPHRFRKLGHGKCSEVYELKPYELVIKKQLLSYFNIPPGREYKLWKKSTNSRIS